MAAIAAATTTDEEAIPDTTTIDEEAIPENCFWNYVHRVGTPVRAKEAGTPGIWMARIETVEVDSGWNSWYTTTLNPNPKPQPYTLNPNPHTNPNLNSIRYTIKWLQGGGLKKAVPHKNLIGKG